MNAIRFMLRDHDDIGKLFNQFVDAGEEAYQTKKQIADEVIQRITRHAELEEQVLFAAFKEKGGEEAEEMVTYGTEEHQVTKFIMDRLGRTRPEDKTFEARFKILMEGSRHHFLDEEMEIFPKIKKVLSGPELERLGKELQSRDKR
jgi:hemerythrin-like domain-containing protein